MSTPRTINLEGAGDGDFTVLDNPENTAVEYLYGGRYRSDDYIQVDGENGPKNMHKVTVEILCDNAQFIALMQSSESKGRIQVQLV